MTVKENKDIFDFMNDRTCDAVLRATPSELECRPAKDIHEHKEAFRLIYREYFSRGYCEEHESNMHYHSYCMLPLSRSFILKRRDLLLGTISLIKDNPCGFPMESFVPGIVGKLRSEGKQIAELTLLSLDHSAFRTDDLDLRDYHKLAICFWLFKTMLDYARHEAGITDLVITIHPRHERLYQKLGFKPLGNAKPYAGASEHLGLPMHLDVVGLEQFLPKGSRFREFFFEDELPKEILRISFGWTPEALNELISAKYDVWHPRLSHPVEFLKRRHPEIAASPAFV